MTKDRLAELTELNKDIEQKYSKMSVQLEDNMEEVMKALAMSAKEFLYTAGAEVTNEAKKNARTDTGYTKSGWKYEVNENGKEVIVGNIHANAVWEEFGTGIHAENADGTKSGKGRQTPWRYKDKKGNYVWTRGKTATHNLTKSIDKVKGELKEKAQEAYRRGMK